MPHNNYVCIDSMWQDIVFLSVISVFSLLWQVIKYILYYTMTIQSSVLSQIWHINTTVNIHCIYNYNLILILTIHRSLKVLSTAVYSGINQVNI